MTTLIRRGPLFVLGLGLAAALAAPQVPPPPAGTYTCQMWSLGPAPYGSGMSYSIQVSPSVLGRVVLDGKGSYRLDNSRGGTGRYTYHAARPAFTFTTGPMNVFPVRYEYSDDGFKQQRFTLQLLDGKTGKDEQTSCSLTAKTRGRPLSNVPQSGGTPGGSGTGGAAQAQPRAGDPNPGFRGTLIFSGGGTIQTLNLATGQRQNRLGGTDLSQSRAGEVVYVNKQGALGFAGRNLQLSGSLPRAAGEDEVSRPALAPDGKRVAYDLDNYPGWVGVVVRSRAGQRLAAFELYTSPSWTPDGRLVMARNLRFEGSEPGLWISTPDLKTLKRIPVNLDDLSEPAVSPDGKKVAFISNGDVWTANLDGSGLNQRTNTDLTETNVAWSPDSQSLAFGVTSYQTLYLLGPGSQTPREVRDARGEVMTSGSRLVWR